MKKLKHVLPFLFLCIYGCKHDIDFNGTWISTDPMNYSFVNIINDSSNFMIFSNQLDITSKNVIKNDTIVFYPYKCDCKIFHISNMNRPFAKLYVYHDTLYIKYHDKKFVNDINSYNDEDNEKIRLNKSGYSYDTEDHTDDFVLPIKMYKQKS